MCYASALALDTNAGAPLEYVCVFLCAFTTNTRILCHYTPTADMVLILNVFPDSYRPHSISRSPNRFLSLFTTVSHTKSLFLHFTIQLWALKSYTHFPVCLSTIQANCAELKIVAEKTVWLLFVQFIFWQWHVPNGLKHSHTQSKIKYSLSFHVVFLKPSIFGVSFSLSLIQAISLIKNAIWSPSLW